MRLFLLFILPVYLLLFGSCKKNQPADPAFFITSKTISVATNPSHEGTGSHKISDLFWYVNGKYQGTYPVGNLMPVVSNNEAVRINVFAGIKNNGISDTRLPYPFFDFLIVDTTVASGKTISRDFAFKYKTNTVFAWLENFDQPIGLSVEKDKRYDGVVDFAPPADRFENQSLRISITPGSATKARIVSSGEGFTLPTATGNLFLELNYKSNTPFTIGLTDGTNDVGVITMNAQPNWNKTYIQLSTALNSLPTNKCKVYFEFFSPADDMDSQLFLDNIKLLYLP